MHWLLGWVTMVTFVRGASSSDPRKVRQKDNKTNKFWLSYITSLHSRPHSSRAAVVFFLILLNKLALAPWPHRVRNTEAFPKGDQDGQNK
jgi:hypothetical protein